MELSNTQKDSMSLIIRVAKGSLLFAVGNGSNGKIEFEPYAIKSGMSMAANMREAYKISPMLQRKYSHVVVMVDSGTMLIPTDEFSTDSIEDMYNHTFSDSNALAKLHSVLPELNAVAVFSMNKDLKMVIEEHFSSVRFTPVASPVWSHMHARNFDTRNKKLYAYFHDGTVDVFSFHQNRFKFHNNFPIQQPQDALYYILYVYRTLRFDVEQDSIVLSGKAPDGKWIEENLERFVRNITTLPDTFTHELPANLVALMPYDMRVFASSNR